MISAFMPKGTAISVKTLVMAYLIVLPCSKVIYLFLPRYCLRNLASLGAITIRQYGCSGFRSKYSL